MRKWNIVCKVIVVLNCVLSVWEGCLAVGLPSTEIYDVEEGDLPRGQDYVRR